ncbi:MAG TPA: winged helix DNA-binding domain-containing protein, partial [Rubrobacteraceae bacterium]|nr:winged helix DNA-binding domain-containing protein [Rubrobacteraceae bacterium]
APVSKTEHPRELLRRYLAAFGPATVQDAQAWSGLTRLGEAVEAMKPELRVFRDERGRELLDLPGAPLPSPDAPAPVRFVPEYDNLVLSHADRTRVIADEHRKAVFLTAGRVRATILVDGLVAGVWKIEKSRNLATLVIEAFERLSRQDHDSLTGEGERLVRFVGDDVKAHAVRFEIAR